MKSSTLAAQLLASGVGLLATVSTQAQSEQTGGSARGQLEEIIVTAQKRSENVQNVPIAMQAYTADQLQKARVSELTDITHMAPNLNVVVQNALSQHVVIRGVGTNEFFGNAPSSVGMYMDEVTMNSSYMSTLGLFDMERIEVLRGPQNSLFGRNTTGGAINYITHQPTVGESAGRLRAGHVRAAQPDRNRRRRVAAGRQPGRGAHRRHLSFARRHLEQPRQQR